MFHSNRCIFSYMHCPGVTVMECKSSTYITRDILLRIFVYKLVYIILKNLSRYIEGYAGSNHL